MTEPENKQCTAYGCPRRGTIHTGSWICRYHYGTVSNKWPAITTRLKNHEPEVNWYEKLLCGNEVDFLFGELKNRWPIGMEPGKDEIFHDYRQRIEQHVNKLLTIDKVVIEPDRKMAASGDDTFKTFADVSPEF